MKAQAVQGNGNRIARARELLARGDGPAAERICSQLLAGSSSLPAAKGLMCRALLAQQKVADARRLIDQIEAEGVVQNKVMKELGAALKAGQARGLSAEIRAAMQSSDFERARSLLNLPIAEIRAHAGLHLLHARLLLAEGHLAYAEAECGIILAERPTDDCKRLLCNILVRQRRLREARDLFCRSIWSDSSTPEQKAMLLGLVSDGMTLQKADAFFSELQAQRAPSEVEIARMAMFEVSAGRPSVALARLGSTDMSALSPAIWPNTWPA